MTNFMEMFWEFDCRLVFETMINVVVHQYQISCSFKLLMSNKKGN